MGERVAHRLLVQSDQAGQRLDQLLAAEWPDFSRSRLAAWIRAGEIRVNGQWVKPRHSVAAGDQVSLETELAARADAPAPEAIGLDLLFEDEVLMIVDKPAGLVVHPGSGNPDGTLVNALLHHDPALAALPRAGLVHRLDKDTSGCLVIARSPRAHRRLVAAMKDRAIHRRYQALVWGDLIAGGRVDEPIGRHPVDRRRQVVRADGRAAITHYRIGRRLTGATLLDVRLETGRTHQIRVHMAHIRHPIVGDPVYGRSGAPAGLTAAQREAWQGFGRQALHAVRLELAHPESGETVAVNAPLPADLTDLIERLEPGHEPDPA
ncbi:23S rRNA pseudouridine(1911/1915/1917) synthase RluD [Wenzhouxiangella limi]|uniref:Pseudouridine synthase n=1 Tax=Wenzhouxiangella limi TaxID=2707351 RepID=A0A845VCC0_9GAMM|nr:23S rRNA pseudouridine(1911/1915/1917) synthase RluD [Wenzhouxiangella limi]